MKDIRDCINILKDYYHEAKIFISAILPRLDSDQYRVRHLNKESSNYISKLTSGNVQFIDLSSEFLRSETTPKYSLFRVSEGFPDDKVHLSVEGSDLLFYSFDCLVREGLEEQSNRKLPHLMNSTEWNAWREATYGPFVLTNRFRITNYTPAVARERVTKTTSSTNVSTFAKENINNFRDKTSVEYCPKMGSSSTKLETEYHRGSHFDRVRSSVEPSRKGVQKKNRSKLNEGKISEQKSLLSKRKY